MYHSHHNAADQVTRGLLGAIIVEPKDKSKEPQFDSDYTLILNDYNVGLTLNGKSFPATAPIIANVWAFHCHILTHAESPHGMFGMVTALIVE